nr:hypothetical protein [Tanacetum cinerariifolium]
MGIGLSLGKSSMDKENLYNENNRYKLCLQIEAAFSGTEEKDITSESPVKGEITRVLARQPVRVAAMASLQASSVNLVAREKLSDVYLEIAARIQTDEPDTGGGGDGRHQFPVLQKSRVARRAFDHLVALLEYEVAEDTDFKREGSNLYVDSKISYSQIGVEGERLRLQAKMKAWKHTGLERADTIVLNS